MPLQETSGAASYDAFGGGVAAVPNYIEDVFSTWLYTGNGSTQTINNGIDLSGKGGLVWGKSRTAGSNTHRLQDTARGVGNEIFTSLTNAQNTGVTGISSFNSNGFTLSGSFNNWNNNGANYVSWTFRKQAKFFDVVTFTGNGQGYFGTNLVSHSLASVPGCVMIKRTDSTGGWFVFTRQASDSYYYLLLNSTASGAGPYTGSSYGLTSTTIDVAKLNDIDTGNNINGASYVMYLFAHNAGGFGLTGTDNVISCGSYVASSAGISINLGYEAQWVMVKSSTATGGWYMLDNMRGMGLTGYLGYLDAASTSNEPGFGSTPALSASATGFIDNGVFGTDGRTNIYIAIRRGPMKTPTSGTSVFTPVAYTGDGSASRAIFSGGFNPDMVFLRERGAVNYLAPIAQDRLRGTPWLYTPFSDAEVDNGSAVAVGFNSKSNTLTSGTTAGTDTNRTSITYSMETFARAPGFFDVVCWTGDATEPRAINHNLTASPELLIIKKRSAALDWWVMTQFTSTAARFGNLNLTDAVGLANYTDQSIIKAQPTSTTFTVGNSSATNQSGATYVAYLFASCPGVSKVGSYTGTGATQTISCGFAARFVLIKRTDSTGSWWVWDTARGMVAGTDPRLPLNNTNAETNANWVYTNASGFQIVTTDATVNASGGSYIYLAIA